MQITIRNDKEKRRYKIAATVILVLGVVFSLVIWQVTRQALHKTTQSRFDHYADMIGTLIQERVDEHIAALRGLRAFIDSSEKVTRVEWQTFVKDLDISHHFKGCIGFSFVRYVPRRTLEQFLAETKADGFPDYSITTSGNNPELFLVEMIQPLEQNLHFVGYDLAQDETFREIFQNTEGLDQAAISYVIKKSQGAENSPTVLLTLPAYRKAGDHRHNANNLLGWVGASILVPDMLNSIEKSFNSLLDIEVLDIGEGQPPYLLYNSDGYLHTAKRTSQNDIVGYEIESLKTIVVAGRTWSLNVFALPGFSGEIGRYMPTTLLVAGLLLSLLSSFLVASYGKPLENARKLAEEIARELHASEQRFYKMFQKHNAVMLLVDPETQEIVDANEAALTYYGYTREQIISLPIAKINTLTADETIAAMQKVKRGEGDYFEFKHALSNGELREVAVYSSPITIDNHALLFSIIHDITERKFAEEELLKYRKNLESLVDAKTQELKDAQSVLLQRERLSTLGEITATVSHELRNPLGTIKSALFSIDNCLERQDMQGMSRPLELAERSIDRCVRIIEELNSYTRVKKLEILETPLDDWLKKLCEEQVVPETIHFELNLSCGINVAFDREKLRQVMINLISNAVHALQEKGSTGNLLKISTHQLDSHYEIYVSDNGIGISDEAKEKMFEPLYSTKGFGVGLGMVIVKNIIEQHHGEIFVESEIGKGTTIGIRLPKISLNSEDSKT